MLQYVKKNSDQVLFGIYVCTKNSNKLNTKHELVERIQLFKTETLERLPNNEVLNQINRNIQSEQVTYV